MDSSIEHHLSAGMTTVRKISIDMNKVIIFRSDLLPASETFIKEQALALARWQPVLVGYRIVKHGLELDPLDTRLIPGSISGRWQRLRLRSNRWLGTAHAPTVNALRAINADLVHVHFGTDAVDIWPSVCKLGLPMLVTLHGYDINIYREWWEAGHGSARRRHYPRQLLSLAREPRVHFIAVSEAIRMRAVELGIPPNKITVRYIGVDIDIFQPGPRPLNERPKRILFVGRLVEKKGLPHLVRAFARLRQHMPEAELTIIGDGPARNELETLSAMLNIPVDFRGTLTNSAVRDEINHARVLCLPSIRATNGDAEGFGMVILEAQASGVPVISSAFGGAQEGILDRVTGFSFDEADELALFRHLHCLLSDEKTLLLMSNNASAFVRRNFDLHLLTLDLETYYDKISESDSISRK